MGAPGPRILIVDDSEDDTLLAATRLRRALPDVAVSRVDSPEGMRRALDRDDWDLVISDHAMPRFDSMGALDVLKASGKPIPFIVYSGNYGRDQGLQALRAGVRDFVRKGDAGRLVPVVQRELARRSRQPGEDAGARIDPVTGLADQEWLLQQLDAALAAPADGEPTVALLRIDLDRFHRINRAYGATTGDRLLADVAARVQDELAACDLLARGEEDEFVCLLDRFAEPAAALRRAERIVRALDEPFLRDGNSFFVTASAGLAVFPRHGRDSRQLWQGALRALDRARSIGVNRAAFAPDAPPAVHVDLGTPIPVSELFVVAQPIVALASRRTWGAEAIARRHHPSLGLLAPDGEAVVLASEPGRGTIAGWLLDEAANLGARLRRGGLADARIAVNLSRSLLADQTLPGRLAASLERAGMPPDSVEIEIAERWVLADPARTLEAARRLRALGLRIALDEFGTTYGPLAPLHGLAVDTLKLSPALVRDSRSGEAGDGALRGALALAKALGAAVVATGVETQADCAHLAALGVDRAQGAAFPGRRVDAATLLPAGFDAPGAPQHLADRREQRG